MNTQLFLITVVFLSFTCNSYADVVSTQITKNPLTHYTRGYEDLGEANSRSLYGGISINLSKLLYQNGWRKTGKTLEYFQLPYSTLKVSKNLD